jgi:sarcosine oxidase
MGSAAAHHLAARGAKVLGLEQFTPAHNKGSSHGKSRVIRLAYFEHPAYVPLLRRAYELWAELERETGRSILTETGGLMIGQRDSEVVSGSLRSAREYGLAHEMLDASQIRRRFPPLTPPDGLVALYETRAGVVRPEEAIHAHLERAAANGAELAFDERVVSWQAAGSEVTITTTKRRVSARQVILTPGPWAPNVFDLPDLPLVVERQVLHWFEPAGGPASFDPRRFPIYIWDLKSEARSPEPALQFYGFPADADGLVKVAFFRTGTEARCTADSVDRQVHPDEVAAMRKALDGRIPGLAGGKLVDSVTCLYTVTPDHHFVIGPHPRYDRVTIASPCSGHGYKFTPVVGEVLADLALEGRTRHPSDLFSPTRF